LRFEENQTVADVDAKNLYKEAQSGHGCMVLDAFNGMTLDQIMNTYAQFNIQSAQNAGRDFLHRVDLNIDTVKIPSYRWSDNQSMTLRADITIGDEKSTPLFRKYVNITDGTIHTECKPDALKSPKETKVTDKKF
jgi:hypothetical protein